MNITVVRDVTLKQHKNKKELKLYLSYRSINLVGEDVEAYQLFYSMDIPCRQLGVDDECMVHGDLDSKPIICHRYPMEPDSREKCSYEFQPFNPLELGNSK